MTEEPKYSRDILSDKKKKADHIKELSEQKDGKKLIETDEGKKTLALKWMEKAHLGEAGKEKVFEKLGINADTPAREFLESVKKWQKENGLKDDGVLGWATLEAIDKKIDDEQSPDEFASDLDYFDGLARYEEKSRREKEQSTGATGPTGEPGASGTAAPEKKEKEVPKLDPKDTKNIVYQDGKLFQHAGGNVYGEIYDNGDTTTPLSRRVTSDWAASLDFNKDYQVMSYKDASALLNENSISKTEAWISSGPNKDKYLYIPKNLVDKNKYPVQKNQ